MVKLKVILYLFSFQLFLSTYSITVVAENLNTNLYNFEVHYLSPGNYAIPRARRGILYLENVVFGALKLANEKPEFYEESKRTLSKAYEIISHLNSSDDLISTEFRKSINLQGKSNDLVYGLLSRFYTLMFTCRSFSNPRFPLDNRDFAINMAYSSVQSFNAGRSFKDVSTLFSLMLNLRKIEVTGQADPKFTSDPQIILEELILENKDFTNKMLELAKVNSNANKSMELAKKAYFKSLVIFLKAAKINIEDSQTISELFLGDDHQINVFYYKGWSGIVNLKNATIRLFSINNLFLAEAFDGVQALVGLNGTSPLEGVSLLPQSLVRYLGELNKQFSQLTQSKKPDRTRNCEYIF